IWAHMDSVSDDRPLEPTRTVLISGFQDEASHEEYRKSKIPREKIMEEYTIQKTNMLFMIFYDVRDAIEFVRNFSEDSLSIHHTISKYEIPRRGDECGEKNIQSSVNFYFKGLDVVIEDSFISSFLHQYGEIREVRNSKPHQKTVEFFDIRSARKAFASLNESAFGTGVVKCRWVWDLLLSHRTEYLRLTDSLLKDAETLFRSTASQATPKRFKSNTSESGGLTAANGKNLFIDLFDKYICENIAEVEKAFK
ncbi:hypothetical protein PAEPH01_2108, partial [Pancytospora epiphaga]